MTYDILISNITIVKSTVFEHYTYIPSATGAAQDLTGATFSALVKDRPGGTTIATFTCTANTAPPGVSDGTGWVQVRLDNSDTITAGYKRGYWYLTVSIDSGNPAVVEAGTVDIVTLI